MGNNTYVVVRRYGLVVQQELNGDTHALATEIGVLFFFVVAADKS